MAGYSTYAAHAFLAWISGTEMPSEPAGCYVALYNGDPGNAGSGGSDVTEDVRSDGRVEVTFGAPSDKRIENDAPVEFGASETGVTVTHFGVWDAATGGNFLGGRSLQTPRVVSQGDPVTFLTGDLAFDIAPK